MKRRLISLTLIFILCFNTAVFAIDEETKELSSKLGELSVESMINEFINLSYEDNQPSSRYELGNEIIKIINSNPDSDNNLVLFAKNIYSYAETHYSISDMQLGLDASEFIKSTELRQEYISMFETKLDVMAKDLFGEDSYDDIDFGDDDKVTNVIDNKPNSGDSDNASNENDYFPEDAKYTEISYYSENNKCYKNTKYYDYDDKLIKEVVSEEDSNYCVVDNAYPEYENEENGDNTTGNNNGNNPSNGSDYKDDEANNLLLTSPIYNEAGDMVATESEPGVYQLNQYKFYYTKDRYRDNPQYQYIGLEVVGNVMNYDELSKIFSKISTSKQAYFVEENEKFVAIIDGSTYSFRTTDTITINEFNNLFNEVDYVVKAKVSATTEYTLENFEGVNIELKNTNSKFETDKQYNYIFMDLKFMNTKLIKTENTLLFPLKSIAKDLGYTVFESETELRLTKDETVIIYTINSDKVTKNDVEYTLSSNNVKTPTGEVYGVLDIGLFELEYNSIVTSENNIITVTFTN